MVDAAIAGLGRWGRNLVRSVNGESERIRFVRGVVRHPDNARDFAAEQGLDLSASLAEALADPRVRAVVLATPHSLHVDQVTAAAGAGKAVCCEKPLALTRAEAERAVAACRAAGVVLATGQDKRFWASMQELQRVVASGELGEILHVEGNASNEWSRNELPEWRKSREEAPGGGMTGTGIHIVDAFVHLVGPVRRVHAQLVTRQTEPEPLDTASVMFEFDNGVSGLLGVVRATPLFWRVHVFGTRASIEALGENEVVFRASGTAPQRRALAPVDALRFELEAFADAIEGHGPYPVTTGEMIQVVAAMEAINQSMESGGVVTIRH